MVSSSYTCSATRGPGPGREADLATRYLQPGLRHLELGLQTTDAPTYIQGLIAYYRKELAQAPALAKQAQVLTPWLPEPLRLEGDINHAQAVAELQTQRGPEARVHLEQAAARHAAAVAIAGSDGSLHISEAHDRLRLFCWMPRRARTSTTARAAR